MKKYNILMGLTVIEFLIGVFFLINSMSDIQLGFGLLFILQGMIGFVMMYGEKD